VEVCSKFGGDWFACERGTYVGTNSLFYIDVDEGDENLKKYICECVAVVWLRSPKNSVMTFPIKKRINTEPFIDERAEPNFSGELEEGKSWRQDQQEVGMQTITAATLK